MSIFSNTFLLATAILFAGKVANGQCESGEEVIDITICGDITSDLVIILAEAGNVAAISDGLSFSEGIGSAVASAIVEAVTVVEQGGLDTIAAAVADAASVYSVAEALGQEHTEAVVEAVAGAFASDAGVAFADALGLAALESNCTAVIHVSDKALGVAGEAIADAVTEIESVCMVSTVKDVVVDCSPTVQNCTAFIGSGCCIDAIMLIAAEDTCRTLYTSYTYKGVCSENTNQVLMRPGFGSECVCVA
eukprot:TRINITY_DN626_c0_g1_i2.p1 TRINITY_DN626_c0_g1~~TRINITY_DN626_c0_g1_i2.p1  ORF type:complete len:249 (-),score=42.03 TRINITY_DN626_c0_g1_i2:334-1080(-)